MLAQIANMRSSLSLVFTLMWNWLIIRLRMIRLPKDSLHATSRHYPFAQVDGKTWVVKMGCGVSVSIIEPQSDGPWFTRSLKISVGQCKLKLPRVAQSISCSCHESRLDPQKTETMLYWRLQQNPSVLLIGTDHSWQMDCAESAGARLLDCCIQSTLCFESSW